MKPPSPHAIQGEEDFDYLDRCKLIRIKPDAAQSSDVELVVKIIKVKALDNENRFVHTREPLLGEITATDVIVRK